MNSKRAYFLLLGILALFIVGLFGGTYGVNSLLQSRSKALVALKLENEVLAEQQSGLITAKSQVKKYSDLEKIARSIVPQDKNQAQAVLEIAKIATDSGISQLSSVTFPASTLGGVGAASPGAVAPSAAANSAASKLTQLLPVKGLAGVYQLQITIDQTSDNAVTYDQFTTFLSKLEQNRRTAQVGSITLQPDSKNPDMVAFTLIINEFIKP